MGKVKNNLVANIIRLSWVLATAPVAYYFFGNVGLVVAFATIEWPAMLFYWRELAREGMFSATEEAGYIAVAVAGAAVAGIANAIVLPILIGWR